MCRDARHDVGAGPWRGVRNVVVAGHVSGHDRYLVGLVLGKQKRRGEAADAGTLGNKRSSLETEVILDGRTWRLESDGYPPHDDDCVCHDSGQLQWRGNQTGGTLGREQDKHEPRKKKKRMYTDV